MENLHILFWLIKDICWCLSFKPLGVLMIFPTFLMALYITWHNRARMAELAHNLAMALWILANSLWMIFEFTGTDEEFKYYCLIPFGAGLAILLYYYLVYAPQHRKLVASASLVAVQQEDPAVERLT
ncbi:MAG: hypothetical protein JNL51_01755 [Chitinophagaceae bacterium]|nr:hypothetical protein [Chitinophagaceae bacterium]